MDETTDRITFRTIQDDDVDRLRRLFFRLSPETIHLRFFQPVKSPSERMLHHLAEVDHQLRQAIVAVVGDEIVGVARYDRSADDDTHAEVAIVVEDAWQHHGLGERLLRRLTRDAAERGVDTFTATALGDNRRVLRLVHRIAPELRSRLDHGEWILEVPVRSA